MPFTSKITGLALAFLGLVCMLTAPALALQSDLPKINVLADPSLTVAISTLGRQFAHDQGFALSAAFAPDAQHAATIESGLDADVFITTSLPMLERLERQGLIDVYSKTPIGKNRMALASFSDNPLDLVLIPRLPLASIFEKTDPSFSFTIGDPQFHSSGRYALRALRAYQMAGELEPYMLFIRGQFDLRSTIAQQGGYGLLYASEAKGDPRLKKLAVFPEEAHSPILYYAVAVAGEQMEASRRFIEYLTSASAQAQFEALGFELVPQQLSEPSLEHPPL